VFKKFSYRGIDLDTLLGLSKKDLMDKLLARQRRRLSSRGLQPKTQTLINKLRAAKKAAPPGEKPAVIKTHLRNMVILPEMIGSVIGVYNGKGEFKEIGNVDGILTSSKKKCSTLWRLSPTWLDIIWESFPSPTSQFVTVARVSAPRVLASLFLLSKI
jgi:ribosomal protein uS19